MKGNLFTFLLIVLVLTGCATTKQPEIVSAISEEDEAVSSMGTFHVDGQPVRAGLGAVVIGDYLYVAGQGDMGYELTSLTMAKGITMQLIAEYAQNEIITAGHAYIQGSGIVNSSVSKDVQSIVDAAVAVQNVASAQVSGVEYVDYQVDETEKVYILARVKMENISEFVRRTAETILRNDASVQASEEASNFFEKLAKDGIF